MIYKKLIIEDTKDSASDEDIKRVENTLRSSLPQDYRNFLKTCNGGYLEYDIEVVFDDSRSEWLSYSTLYGVDNSDDWGSNPYELKQWQKQEGFPGKCVLPIARDGGGSVLYIDLRNGYHVVAFVEGLPGWAGLRQDDSLVVVAESFDEYLSKLTLSNDTIEYHIDNFKVSEESAKATLEWFDSARQNWRVDFKDKWNARVPFMQV